QLDLAALLLQPLEPRRAAGDECPLPPLGDELGDRSLDHREVDEVLEADRAELERHADRVVVPVQALLAPVREHGHVRGRELVLGARDVDAVPAQRRRVRWATTPRSTALAASHTSSSTIQRTSVQPDAIWKARWPATPAHRPARTGRSRWTPDRSATSPSGMSALKKSAWPWRSGPKARPHDGRPRLSVSRTGHSAIPPR